MLSMCTTKTQRNASVDSVNATSKSYLKGWVKVSSQRLKTGIARLRFPGPPGRGLDRRADYPTSHNTNTVKKLNQQPRNMDGAHLGLPYVRFFPDMSSFFRVENSVWANFFNLAKCPGFLINYRLSLFPINSVLS